MANRMHGVPRPAELEPGQTVVSGGSLGIVHLRQHQDVRHPEDPIGTISAGGRHHAIVVRNNTPRGDAGQMATSAREPFRTLTASCTQSLVLPYGRTTESRSTFDPTPTQMTRDRLALVVPPMGGVDLRDAALEPAPTQTTTTRAALVEVSDADIDGCGFRMFELHEIARTMAMDVHPHGGDYIVLGNKRERMAQYGNAVTPPAMRLLVARVAAAIDEAAAA